MKRVAGLALVAVLAGTLGAACMTSVEGTTPTRVHWLLYGDSLSEGAAPYLTNHESVGGRYFRSTAPCNWIGGLDADPAAYSPDLVLLQFVGNPGPCLNGRGLAEAYEEDLTTIAQFWLSRHVPVVMVLSPKTPDDRYAWARLAELRVAGDLGLTVNDAGAAVELPGGDFTYVLPCRADEDSAKGCSAQVPLQIRVRASDGVHFGDSAPGYSAGAARFADAMAG